MIELKGNVQILYEDKHISCERALVSLRNKTIDAQGSVVYTSPQAIVGGEKVLLDYESNTGVIYEGYVKNGNMLFEGNYIIKSSDIDYLSEDGRFTTCNNCPESWSFSGTRVRAELGGYAYLKNSTLRVGGFPIFWLPYLIVPLKSERQTGLLTPELEKSDSGGWTVSQSFFWAISRSEDATFTLKNYELRGLMGLANFQYMLNPESHGELTTATISDRVFADSKRLNEFRSPESQGSRINRWYIDYNHYHSLPENFTHRLQIANASDLQYPSDFLTRQRGDSAMENRMSLSKAQDRDLFFVDSAFYLNLLQANPLASNNDAIHKIPEINYSRALTPLGAGDLFYDWNFNFSNFSRTEFSWDDMSSPYKEGSDRHLSSTGPSTNCSGPSWWDDPKCSILRDGEFDSKRDIIRTGQRLDFNTSVLKAIPIGESLDFIPRIQYRETQYRFQLNDTSVNVRRYLRTEFGLRTTLSAIYDGSRSETADNWYSYKHEIFPEIAFTQIPWIDHPAHPFFGSQNSAPFIAQRNLSDLDINSPYGLQFDFSDRLYDRKMMTLAFTNKLVQKKSSKPSGELPSTEARKAEYKQIVYWKLSQSVDFYKGEIDADDHIPVNELQSKLEINLNPITFYQDSVFFPVLNVSDNNTRVRYTDPSLNFYELQHILTHGKDPSMKTAWSSNEYGLTVKRSTKYLDFLGRAAVNGIPDSTKGEITLKSLGYGLQFKLPGECWNFTFVQISPLDGDNRFYLYFDFAWAGKPVPSLPETLLNGHNL